MVRNSIVAVARTQKESMVFGNGDNRTYADPILAESPDPYIRLDGSGGRHDDGTFETAEAAIASISPQNDDPTPEEISESYGIFPQYDFADARETDHDATDVMVYGPKPAGDAITISDV